MEKELGGLHHITAIASEPQQNVNFYAQVLGLRLVKVTVNYDDPGSYHLYYGDAAGSPGSILTFFAWPDGAPGRVGTGQATVTSFIVPENSLPYWQARFERFQVRQEAPVSRWDEAVLAFYDPDGMKLELVAQRGAEHLVGWEAGPVSLDYATRGFHSVTLAIANSERTHELLTATLGFQLEGRQGERSRYVVGPQGRARTVDVLTLPNAARGTVGVGNVHHIAWRVSDDAQQEAWQKELQRLRYGVSPVMDRQYFHSIYFREPGGVLFEVATDPPGFTADEPLAALGTSLRLPEWLEPHREEIQQALPPLTLPEALQEA